MAIDANNEKYDDNGKDDNAEKHDDKFNLVSSLYYYSGLLNQYHTTGTILKN